MTVVPESFETPDAGAYTGTGFFSVRSLPEQALFMILQLGSGVLVLFGLCNLAISLLLPDFLVAPSGMAVTSAATIALGTSLGVLRFWFPDFVDRRVAVLVHSIVVTAGLLITFGLAAAGEAYSYAAVLYVILVIFAVFLMRPPAAACNLLLVGIEYAIVVTFQVGARLPAVQWAYLMLPSFVVAVTFGLMLQRTDRLAQSEKRAREEALAATEAKSAFLATMSHEIRTPLNAVLGMTHLLLDTDLTAEQQDFARTISVSGEALLSIINDILDFSKIEAGHIELDMHPFDIRQLVEQALDVGAPAAAAKGIELAGCVYDRVPRGLVGDATRLRQILLNLLNNAVKFTPGGEVVLTVGAEQIEGSRVLVRATVRDTGIGIPEDRIEALFDSFTQLDASTTRKFGGTGLGLAISRRLASLMDGRLWAESDGVDRGSAFHLEFPAAIVELPTSGGERDARALSDLRVLVVDDNATNRYLVRMQTESWGFFVRDTELPREALEWVDRGDPFDLAILDMQMPEMDGLELAAALHARRGSQLPILIMTSLGRVASRGDDTSVAWLTKPVKPSQLFDTLVGLVGTDPGRSETDREIQPPPERTTSEFDGDLAGRHPLRILLAEDNPLNQKMALQTLARLGYTAAVANNGREAIEQLRSASYDVVLMDVQMPEMDGLSAARHICAEWSRDRRPRLVAMTANAVSGDRQECLEAGMDDYVAKPIRVGELVAALERVPAAPSSTSSTAARADAPAVHASLQALVGDDDRAILGLLDLFLSDSAPLLDQLATDAAHGDVEAFTRRAHTLKSNAASFGAPGLAETCRQLELAGRSGEIGGIGTLLDAARGELGQLVTDVHALREELV